MSESLIADALHDLAEDLIRRAHSCDIMADGAEGDAYSVTAVSRLRGKASAYRHAAEMLARLMP